LVEYIFEGFRVRSGGSQPQIEGGHRSGLASQHAFPHKCYVSFKRVAEQNTVTGGLCCSRIPGTNVALSPLETPLSIPTAKYKLRVDGNTVSPSLKPRRDSPFSISRRIWRGNFRPVCRFSRQILETGNDQLHSPNSDGEIRNSDGHFSVRLEKGRCIIRALFALPSLKTRIGMPHEGAQKGCKMRTLQSSQPKHATQLAYLYQELQLS